MISSSSMIDKNLPKIGKELLRKLEAGEMTVDEFDREISYWMIQSIRQLVFEPEPAPPHDLVELSARKDARIAPEFWLQPHIREYNAERSGVIARNRGNWYWLCSIKRAIPKDDDPAHRKIRAVMDTYTRGKPSCDTSLSSW